MKDHFDVSRIWPRNEMIQFMVSCPPHPPLRKETKMLFKKMDIQMMPKASLTKYRVNILPQNLSKRAKEEEKKSRILYNGRTTADLIKNSLN